MNAIVNLNDMARRIDDEWRVAQAEAKSSVERAIGVGKMLADVKHELPHGEFITWVEKHCPFGRSTAARLMRLSANVSRVTHLSSINEALKLLAEPRQERPAPPAGWRPEDDDDSPPTFVGGVTLPPPTIDPPPSGDDEPPVVEDLPAPRSNGTPRTRTTADVYDLMADDGDPPEPPAEPGRDRLGVQIPNEQIQKAFDRARELRAIAGRVAMIKEEVVNALEAGDALYKHIVKSAFIADANNLRRHIMYSIPYGVCCYCGGEGCKACRGQGWLNKTQYEVAPEESRSSMMAGAAK